ncbi:serpin family protein [Halorubrum gandharaense]
MDRRALLSATGMLAAAALAGCVDAPTGEESTPTQTDTPTETPPDGDGDGDEPDALPTGEPSAEDPRLRELVAGNAGFAMDLHHEFVADDDAGNVFYSPYSVSMALAMTYAGAAADAERAMRETLSFSLAEETHPAFSDLQAELDERETTEDPMPDDDEDAETDAFQLSVANALWGDEGFPVDGDFLELVDNHYRGGYEKADFAGDPEGERERINAWVADATEDRIEDLIPEGGITSQTVMVLANAIYFMASWEQEFDPDDTTDATFTALDGSTSEVPMMEQNLRTDYVDLPRAQAIELPYVGGEVSMVLVVPDEGEFESVEADIDGETLFGIFEALGDASGDLRMPRFEYEFDAELREPLEELGMGAAFGPGADFSEMVEGSGGPGIDEVFHDAFVSVDEEGTEAAAATAVVMLESAPPESFDLTLDRPFLFFIRDRPTDAVLFAGRVTDAGAAQE